MKKLNSMNIGSLDDITNVRKSKKLSISNKINFFIIKLNVLEPFSRLNFALEII